MSGNLYSEAMNLFSKGNYEAALAILMNSKEHLSSKEKQLLEVCKKSITDKYYYIIKECIEQGDISNARKNKAEYERIFNFDARIANLVIPESNAGRKTGTDENRNIGTNAFKRLFHSKLGIIGILVILIGGVIAAVINSDNRNEKMSAAPSIDTLTTDTLTIDSALANIPDEPDRFEFKDIKRRNGNFKVIVEWPVSMTGIGDISKLHKCLTNKVFNRDCNDIYDCIEQYLKEGEESAAETEYDVNGFVSLKFVQRQNNIYIFNKLTFADYGGAGAAVIYDDSYINFDKELGRDLTIDDLTDNNDALLSVVNSHISLDEYSSKADKLPEKFVINPDGITFIFPQYSIGIGAQGQPHISLSYDEMNGILSETFKRAIGNVPFEEKWESCKLSGTMTDKSGSYPIKMTFERRGHDLRNCIYRNVNYGGEIKMKGFLTQGHWCFIGKDGENDFSIEVDIYNMTGTARVGEKVFSVSFK